MLILYSQCVVLLAILLPASPISPPPRKRPARMCELIKLKKLTVEKDMGLSSKLQIKPPLLSGKAKRPENLLIDRMKYEFSKPYVPPVQHIKTEYQNKEEVKTDFVSDEEVAAEFGPDYNPPCSQLTYETDILNAEDRILERRKKLFIQGMLIICYLYKFYLI